jgi:hypothetical protein
MSVYITSGLLDNPDSVTYPLRHARIGFRTIARRSAATVSASSAASGFPASSAAHELTYEYWRPASLPATWEIDAGASVTCDYCGIAAHTLATDGCAVEVRRDGNVVETIIPTTDDPILVLFEPQAGTVWDIRVSGGTAPSVGVVFFGEALEMPRPIYGGHSPINLSRTTKREPNRSERGQWLGLSVVRQGVTADFGWNHLDPDWYRDYFDPFVAYATQSRGAFFIGWRPVGYPDGVAYAWVDQDDIQPSNEGTREWMEVSLTVRGHVQYQAPDVEDFA